ncbi:snRNA-activating protein complex subunit 4-like [Arapaima gigas]
MAEPRSLAAEREKLQAQIDRLQRSLDVLGRGDETLSCSDLSEVTHSFRHSFIRVHWLAWPQAQEQLVAERERVQKEIEELEHRLSLRDPGNRGGFTAQSEEDSSEELELPQNAETCLQMNLVYQEVLKEKLEEVEQLLHDNREQQREIMAQISGPVTPQPSSSGMSSHSVYLGHFLKPYFKDKVTGLGPPANSETRDKMNKGSKSFADVKIKRWEEWQKTLLFNSVVNDTTKRLLQPKLSKVEYLTEKMAKASDMEKQILQKQIGQIEREIADINTMTQEQLVGNRYDDHDWDKISNIDFEGTRNAEDMKRFWQNHLHPSINKSAWKEDEIEKLKGIVEKNQGCHWDQIAEQLRTNRSAFMCLQTYQRYINKGFRKKAWTKEEDKVLKELISKMRIGNFIPYIQISYFMEGRDSSQLMYRWSQVLDPTLKKGHWSKEEDDLLLKAVEKYGMKDWAKIRTEVPGRTDGQCRDRYLDCLKGGVKKGAWSKDEDALLIKLVGKYGVGRWAKISSEMPNRLDCQCLQRWKSMTGYGTTYRRKLQEKSQDGARRRRKVRKVKEEEEEDSMSPSEDEEELVFMDSEEEAPAAQSDQESETKEYILPSMDEWIPKSVKEVRQLGQRVMRTPPVCVTNSVPAGKSKLGRIPSEHSLIRTEPPTGIRCTVLDASGCPLGVVMDSELQLQEETSGENAMIRLSLSEVRGLLSSMTLQSGTERMDGHQGLARSKVPLGKQQPSGPDAQKPRRLRVSSATRTCSSFLNNQLLHAVLPWMGSLLIHLKSNRRTEADVVREKVEAIGLASTPVFLLFLKILCIDAEGCKKVIEERKKRVVRCISILNYQAAPPKCERKPPKSQVQTVAQMLYEKRQNESGVRVPAQPQKNQMFVPLVVVPQTVVVKPAALQPGPRVPSLSTAPVQPSDNVGRKMQTSNKTVLLKKRLHTETEDSMALETDSANKKACLESVYLKPKQDGGGNQEAALSGPISWIVTPHGLLPVSSLGTLLPAANQSVLKNNLPSSGGAVARPIALTLSGKPTANALQQEKGLSPRATIVSPPLALTVSTSSTGPRAPIANAVRPLATPSPSVPLTVQLPLANKVLSPQVPRTTLTPKQISVTSLVSAASTSVAPSPLIQTALPAASPTQRIVRFFQPRASVAPDRLPSSPLVRTADSVQQTAIQVLQPGASTLKLPQKPVQPPSRAKHLSYDPNLMFLEEESQVREWLKGTNGVALPQLDITLPYLPPFISNLKTLSTLLQHKKMLELNALQLVAPEEDEGEKDKVDAVRRLVAEKLSGNQAYLLLKARFLSCFTLPAFLATIHPRRRPVSPTLLSPESSDREEEMNPDGEGNNEVEFKSLQQQAVLSMDGEGREAPEFTGMSTRSRTRIHQKQ